MNNSVVFYLPPDSLNEATIYYTDLIRRAFIDLGFSIKDSDQVTNIGDPSCIVCIRPGDVLKALQKSSPSKIVSWFQGIGPEEYKVLHPGIRGCIGKYYLNFSEKKALRKSDLCIMVSDSMLKHYEQKYNIHLAHKTVIVPCYNKPIDSQAFLVEDRYNRPKFVYAGALYEWQCIRETLMIFKEIENKNPAAELTILTGQREQAEKLVEEFKLKNVEIDFEPLSTLQDRLQKYKYGFLLRRDNVVNNVATPTKMNSYLAAGLVLSLIHI